MKTNETKPFTHAPVFSENGDQLLFNEKSELIRTEPKKHAPEPWITEKYDSLSQLRLLGALEDDGTKREWIGDIIASGCDINASRIVDCVNAMAGIKNPKTFMDNLKIVMEVNGYDEAPFVGVLEQTIAEQAESIKGGADV
jgi:hypothetical protein